MMKLMISIGVQSGDDHRETIRCAVDVATDATISDVPEAKKHCVPLVPYLNSEAKKPHLYLIHADTLERLDEEKMVKEYALVDGSVVRLKSAVR
jgi:hypothetical protein